MGVVKKLAQLTRDTPDPELFDSQDDCSNLDLLPLSSTQVQLKGICGRQSPGEENYDVPRSALYSTPRGRTEDQENVYNVPHSVQETEDDSLYNIPKRLSGVHGRAGFCVQIPR